jgi:hypothetical protein
MILPVEDDGVRPAGAPDQCFYCHSPKGQHKPDCVCLERTVIVEMSISYVRAVPKSWTVSDIEFLLNDSSSCADNEVRLVAEQADAAPENHCNTCQRTDFRFLREATAEEMEKFGFNAQRKEGTGCAKGRRVIDCQPSTGWTDS